MKQLNYHMPIRKEQNERERERVWERERKEREMRKRRRRKETHAPKRVDSGVDWYYIWLEAGTGLPGVIESVERIRSIIRASLDGLETVEDINNDSNTLPVSVPSFIHPAQYIHTYIVHIPASPGKKWFVGNCYFTLYFQFWLRLSLAVLASWLADPDFILPRRSFSFWIFFISFLIFWLFRFLIFFIFPLKKKKKKSLMRFPIGQIWSDPRSLIFLIFNFQFFTYLFLHKNNTVTSHPQQGTHTNTCIRSTHILRAHTDRRDEDWHFSWPRPLNSNRTTLTQSYRKKWLSNQLASSTDLTRQHRR